MFSEKFDRWRPGIGWKASPRGLASPSPGPAIRWYVAAVPNSGTQSCEHGAAGGHARDSKGAVALHWAGVSARRYCRAVPQPREHALHCEKSQAVAGLGEGVGEAPAGPCAPCICSYSRSKAVTCAVNVPFRASAVAVEQSE